MRAPGLLNECCSDAIRRRLSIVSLLCCLCRTAGPYCDWDHSLRAELHVLHDWLNGARAAADRYTSLVAASAFAAALAA